VKVLFFPGLGADDTLSRYHLLPGHEVTWVKWPKRIEPDWDGFLDRIIAENPVEEGACFVGISFGGLVATRLAARKRPSRIHLVGSLRSPVQVTPLLRFPGRAVAALPRFAFDLSLVPTPVISHFFEIYREEHLEHFSEMAAGFAPEDIRAMTRLALRAGPMPDLGIPVKSVHGERDRLLPPGRQVVDHLIPGGGHLISMTHAGEVNRTLLDWME
jgi:pimeloyl-ACP methyl ester carboxylesterase